jgi:large subunit ribosomal protein L15
MQTNNLKRVHPNKKSTQVGRGGKRGKTSGRGGKGQTARAGHKIRPEIRDMIKRIPKLRGRGKNSFKSFYKKFTPVNLNMIEKHFSAGEVVSPEVLVKKGLAELFAGANPAIKILAEGELTKKILFSDCAFSASAKTKILAAGGSIGLK